MRISELQLNTLSCNPYNMQNASVGINATKYWLILTKRKTIEKLIVIESKLTIISINNYFILECMVYHCKKGGLWSIELVMTLSTVIT